MLRHIGEGTSGSTQHTTTHTKNTEQWKPWIYRADIHKTKYHLTIYAPFKKAWYGNKMTVLMKHTRLHRWKRFREFCYTINWCRVLYDNIQISFNEVSSLVFKPWSFSSSFYSYTFVVNVESQSKRNSHQCSLHISYDLSADDCYNRGFFFAVALRPNAGHDLLILEDYTQQHTTISRTPLDEWSARRRDLYLTTHNTHNRQTSMSPCPPVGFEPTISAGERPQTYALERAATGTGSRGM